MADREAEKEALIECVPVLVTANFARAIAHYTRLGFALVWDEGDGHIQEGYAFARRGGCGVHLAEHKALDVENNHRQAYMVVTDPTALAEEWRAAGISDVYGPQQTSFGLEGTHVDPDNNILRFGSPPVKPGEEFS